MKFSKFADKFVNQSGIGMLMDDLGNALQPGHEVFMLGGGNPAPIPAVQDFFQKSIRNLLQSGDGFNRAVGNYDPPRGNPCFIQTLSSLLKSQLGWGISEKNIALTHGSQQAFFMLFNMFAGPYPDGSRKKILFPLAPEYIGYRDVGLEADLFESVPPVIEMLDEPFFKYRIDFGTLKVSDSIGAICVSRPTNPTGNVLTDKEIKKLVQIAKEKHIPLIIDNAYGKPFPDIIYADATVHWNPNTIICMSLSKLGLPGTRTGIVVGPEDVIDRIARLNAILTLSPGGVGTAIVSEMVKSSQILEISEQVIKPFYLKKRDFAIDCVRTSFTAFDYAIHKPEGAFFLWVWLRGLPISSHELYHRLKKRGVIVVPGHYFFFGLNQFHPHQEQCIRINYAQEKETIKKAFEIIADEVRNISR